MNSALMRFYHLDISASSSLLLQSD